MHYLKKNKGYSHKMLSVHIRDYQVIFFNTIFFAKAFAKFTKRILTWHLVTLGTNGEGA